MMVSSPVAVMSCRSLRTVMSSMERRMRGFLTTLKISHFHYIPSIHFSQQSAEEGASGIDLFSTSINCSFYVNIPIFLIYPGSTGGTFVQLIIF